MKKAIVLFVGALGLLACSKDKPAEDTTSTRGATNDMAAPVSVEEVRTALLEKRPSASESINSLVITNDGGIVTLRGKVEDESTHADLVNRVRAMSNVRGVRDEIMVQPKSSAMGSNDMNTGTTTTTGATQNGAAQPNQGTGSGMGGSSVGGTTDQSGMGSSTMNASSSTVDAVRDSMTRARPKSTTIIQGLTITANDDGSIVTIGGSVPDETTHQSLLKAAKTTDGVKTVKDQMKIDKKMQTKP